MRASFALVGLLSTTAALASGCSLTLGLGDLDANPGSGGSSNGSGGRGAGGSGGGTGEGGAGGSTAGTAGGAGGGLGGGGSGGSSAGMGGSSAGMGAGTGGSSAGTGGSSAGTGGSAGNAGNAGGAAGSGGTKGGAGGGSGTAGSGGTGGAPSGPIDLATGQKTPKGIFVDGAHVYWVNTAPAAIFRVPKAGGSQPEALVTAVDLTAPLDVATDGTTLFWSEPAANLLRGKPLSGGAVKDVGPGAGRVAYLELAAGKIFATDDRTDQPQNGTVSFLTIGTNGFNVVYGSEMLATGVGSDGAGNLAWASAGALILGKVAGGQRSQLLASNGLAVDGLAMDKTYIYWVEAGERIRRAKIADASIVNVWDPPGALGHGDVALDDTWMYWTEPDTGAVRKLLK